MQPTPSLLMRVAALVVFVIAALLGFDVFGDASMGDIGALVATGLGLWVAASLP